LCIQRECLARVSPRSELQLQMLASILMLMLIRGMCVVGARGMRSHLFISRYPFNTITEVFIIKHVITYL
jgi:hypothetical protein